MYDGHRSSKLGLQAGEVERIIQDKYKASAIQIGGSHYKRMQVQPSEFITRNELGWCEGNAIKYICRHHLKGGSDDLDKAIHYLQLLKEWTYGKAEEALPEPPF